MQVPSLILDMGGEMGWIVVCLKWAQLLRHMNDPVITLKASELSSATIKIHWLPSTPPIEGREDSQQVLNTFFTSGKIQQIPQGRSCHSLFIKQQQPFLYKVLKW